MLKRFLVLLALIAAVSEPCHAARLKDVADIEGVRTNQLVGYGVVVGLNGTGDKSSAVFGNRSVSSMMKEFGINISEKEISSKNIAAVVVTAEIPPFIRPGAKIDCTVSSIGDATDLSGGVLLMTPLMGADGAVYAVAQGPLVIGGYNITSGRSIKQKNHPTVGRIPNGAIVERQIPITFIEGNKVDIILRQPDFTTANRITQKINEAFADVARTIDGATVEVRIPAVYLSDPVSFISAIEEIDVKPDTKARIVINERTGTIVVGKDVRISTVAISHGNLNLEVRSKWLVSQPMPLSEGETLENTQAKVRVIEQRGQMAVISENVTVGDIANALNAIGVGPRDMISIFSAIKEAGALSAEIVVI